tara:strand:+ start:506 stop:802 length:297 start_codon:yes stop_codon:yes gene_type:complete
MGGKEYVQTLLAIRGMTREQWNNMNNQEKEDFRQNFKKQYNIDFITEALPREKQRSKGGRIKIRKKRRKRKTRRKSKKRKRKTKRRKKKRNSKRRKRN